MPEIEKFSYLCNYLELQRYEKKDRIKWRWVPASCVIEIEGVFAGQSHLDTVEYLISKKIDVDTERVVLTDVKRLPI